MFAKRFVYACAGVFLLALSYHLGAKPVAAQANSLNVVGMSYESGVPGLLVLTPNGDVFFRQFNGEPPFLFIGAPRLIGNYWAGGPTPTLNESWGQLKARYHDNPMSTQPGTQDR